MNPIPPRSGEAPVGIIREPGLSPAKPPAGIVGVVIPARHGLLARENRPLRRPNRTRPLDR